MRLHEPQIQTIQLSVDLELTALHTLHLGLDARYVFVIFVALLGCSAHTFLLLLLERMIELKTRLVASKLWLNNEADVAA